MIVTSGEYILDINVEKTVNFYRNERYISEESQCDGCENYEHFGGQAPPEVAELFK